MRLKKKVELLEKRIADLEGQVQSQQKNKFVPEDSNGKCHDSKKCVNP